jgi:pilus assembly protein CpaB
MRGKSGVLLIVALGCGMVASVGISQVVIEKQAGNETVEMVEILVATKDIDVSEKITAENIRLEKWPQDRLPEGAIIKLDEVENRFANQRLYEGEPILHRKLMDSQESVALKIPPGHRVFDLSVDDKTGGMGYIQPGDRVDVIGFFPSTSGSSPGQTQTVLRAVSVFGVDGNTIRSTGEGDKKKAASTIQLLIQDSQQEVMTTAAALGQMRVSLCPPGTDKDKVDTGKDFLEWLNGRHPKANTGSSNTELASPASPSVDSSTMLTKVAAATENTAPGEIAIITPKGVTRYLLGKPGELPRVIDTQTIQSTTPSPASGATTTEGGTGATGSSYGGFPVSYPPGSQPTTSPSGSTSTYGAGGRVDNGK